MTIDRIGNQGRELVRAEQDTDSWVTIVADVGRLADYIAGTEFVPKDLRGKPAAVAAAILSGREIGLPPMTAMQITHVVEGRPALSAEGMRALVFSAGHEIEFSESTGAVCTIRGRRRYAENWTTVTWTIDMARAAGVGGKAVWKSYPRAMLQARATTELCRMVFPDVIHGFRSVEELEDMSGGALGDAPVQSGGTATVSRASGRRKAASTAEGGPPAAAAAVPSSPASISGPPLPGESGYDDLTPNGGGEAPDPVSPPPLPDELPAEGKQGRPTTRSSAPRATSTSSTSGRAPDAGPSTEEEDPAAASEERPDAAAGPQPVDPAVDAEVVDDVPAGEPGDEGPRSISQPQMRALMRRFGELGLKGEDNRDRRLFITSQVLRRDIDSTAKLTVAEASTLIDTLARVQSIEALEDLIAQTAKDQS